MKKYVLGLFTAVVVLLLSLNAYALDVGLGIEEDDGDIEIDLSLDWTNETGPWQSIVEFDHVTEESGGEQKTNLTYLNLKQNYQYSDKIYVIGILQFDTDKFREDYETRSVLGGGLGYKIYKSDRIKISNEFSVAYLESNITETIYRNSLWALFKIADKVNLSNKFLYETGNEPYKRNEFEIDYELTENISVGLSWRKIQEGIKDRDTKSLTFKMKF
tara:strand:- start:209 stop:859 length:651 start_codon:yes stop_codon:yes gene_type:complete